MLNRPQQKEARSKLQAIEVLPKDSNATSCIYPCQRNSLAEGRPSTLVGQMGTSEEPTNVTRKEELILSTSEFQRCQYLIITNIQ